MRAAVRWMERYQVPLYLGALAVGAVLGLGVPAVAGPAATALTPVLGLLLYVTFLGVPFARIAQAWRDWRFLSTALVVNFVVVPVVVLGLSRLVSGDRALHVGVLFVLLTPCVDYVIAFTALAGGAKDRLLAATPLLMLGQMLLLPVYLWLMAGPGTVEGIDLTPFLEAFLLLIALPLAAAALTQRAARTGRTRAVPGTAARAMVPLMMVTLAVVVASQIAPVSRQLADLLVLVPVYVLFAVVMVLAGWAAGRLARLDVPGQRAVVFSGATRNSLVILPLVLALPEGFELVPLVVVTQTLVELVLMVVLVRLVPALVPGFPAPQHHVAGG